MICFSTWSLVLIGLRIGDVSFAALRSIAESVRYRGGSVASASRTWPTCDRFRRAQGEQIAASEIDAEVASRRGRRKRVAPATMSASEHMQARKPLPRKLIFFDEIRCSIEMRFTLPGVDKPAEEDSARRSAP